MDATISYPLPGHAVFETTLGFMALAWSDAGLTRLCLPEKTYVFSGRQSRVSPASLHARAMNPSVVSKTAWPGRG